jgi:hypothetical protein
MNFVLRQEGKWINEKCFFRIRRLFLPTGPPPKSGRTLNPARQRKAPGIFQPRRAKEEAPDTGSSRKGISGNIIACVSPAKFRFPPGFAHHGGDPAFRMAPTRTDLSADARAASTAAFRARRLVCQAISSTVFMNLAVSSAGGDRRPYGPRLVAMRAPAWRKLETTPATGAFLIVREDKNT